MAKAQKTNPKKDIQAYVLETLEKSLDKLKEGMSEKKFKRNIKKAGKVMMEDFKIVKQKVVKEKKSKAAKEPAAGEGLA